MSWNVYRIFGVVALCVLFSLHSILIGVISVGMLVFKAGALQFSMDIISLFIIFCFAVLKYIRRNAAPSRNPNLIAFSMLFVLSLIGAIGLTARGASKNGKGLCGDLADTRPESCAEAAVAITFTWITVMFAGGGLAVSWLDRNPRMGSYSPHSPQGPMKELDLSKHSQKSSFHSNVSGPTDSYIPRPRDPYDTPRRKRSTRSQPHQNNPQRVPSNRAPAPPLPPLPAFDPLLALETESKAALRIDHRQRTRRSRSDHRREREDLPDLPQPTRRPPKDPKRVETEKENRLSPTDIYAQCG